MDPDPTPIGGIYVPTVRTGRNYPLIDDCRCVDVCLFVVSVGSLMTVDVCRSLSVLVSEGLCHGLVTVCVWGLSYVSLCVCMGVSESFGPCFWGGFDHGDIAESGCDSGRF